MFRVPKRDWAREILMGVLKKIPATVFKAMKMDMFTQELSVTRVDGPALGVQQYQY